MHVENTAVEVPPAASLVALRFGAFKSLVEQELVLHPLTVLVGKNSSGKSNVIEGMASLARLMSGDAIGEALARGTDVSEPIRGLAQGSVPIGFRDLSLGCDVHRMDLKVQYEVAIRADENEESIRSEQLSAEGFKYRNRSWAKTALLSTLQDDDSVAVTAGAFNGLQGRNPRYQFRREMPLVTQLRSRLPEGKATDVVLEASDALISALNGVMVLDPVPQLMRGYARIGDSELRRSAENISAAMLALRDADPASFDRLVHLLSRASETGADQITFERTRFGDVTFALCESARPGAQQEMPARVLSDGILRLAAIATAVLTGRPGGGRQILVIEELENGLHPSLARDVLKFLRAEALAKGNTVVVSTHSATLMDALTPEDHEGVVLVSRDKSTGRTLLVRLVDAPGYVQAALLGPLGAMLEEGTIPDVSGPQPERELSPVFKELLGG